MAYYGGKSRLAPWIVSLMPEHRVYIEAFAGSAAVLFAKPRSTHEILNDVDGDVVRFFRVLRERPDDLEVACRLSPYSREEWEDAGEISDGLDDLELARRWWVRSSQAFAQVAKVGTGWSMSVQRGSNNARSVWNRLGRFAATADRLGTVAIENRDAVEVLEHYGTPDAVCYADPPYLGSTRSSIAGGRRPGGDYAAEFHSDDDHRRLADALNVFPGTVLLSGYASDLYEDLYDGWSRLERRVLRRSSNGRSGCNTHVTEVVWTNRPLVERLELVVNTESV